MKKIIFLFAATCALTAGAKKIKTVTIPNPAVSYQEMIIPRSVTLSDIATSITFAIAPTMQWGVAATSQLTSEDGKVYHLKSGQMHFRNSLEFNQDEMTYEQALAEATDVKPLKCDSMYMGLGGFYYQQPQALMVTLNFEPVKKGTKVVRFSENTGQPGEFKCYGIRLDGQAYPSLLAKTGEGRTEQPKTTEDQWQKATVVVKVLGDVPADYFRINPSPKNNEEQPLYMGMNTEWTPAEDGSAGGTLTVENAAPCLSFISWSGYSLAFEAVPGRTDTLYIDYPAVVAERENAQYYYTGRMSTANDREKVKEFFSYPKRDHAMKLMEQLDQTQLLTEEQIASVAPAYRPFVEKKQKEVAEVLERMAAGHTGIIKDVPAVPQNEVIQAIADQYRGKVVYMDLWATWCGPCKMGIKAMAPHHDDYAGKDIVFVYVTDESSPEAAWKKMVIDMVGDHYRLKSFSGTEPAINGIPRYLIFDREGKIAEDMEGFGGIETILEKINAVLEK